VRATAALIAALAAAAASVADAGHVDNCAPKQAPASYTRSVHRALLARRDLWGDAILRAPGGPRYAKAAGRLAPLLYAVGANRRPVTSSGVYYLALAMPFSPYGSRDFELHVADGGEILARRIDGARLTIHVGSTGEERYGACIGRLGRGRLLDGYLPVLETSYVDAGGVRYRQESFAARIVRSRGLVSFVHLTADATDSSRGAVVRFGSSTGLSRTQRVPPRGTRDFYIAWPPLEPLDVDGYVRARTTTVAFWKRELDRAAVFDVPERSVLDAERALIVQLLTMTWRYSVGNPYEELSFAEALDTAEVMAEYGYGDIAKAILRFTLRRLPQRHSNFRAGERLAAGALYDRLAHDRAYVREETPVLTEALRRLAREIERGGLLPREPVSTDIGTKIYGLHEQTAVWAGLQAMARVWRANHYPRQAAEAAALARRLGAALRRAVERSGRRSADGSLFVPLALLDGGRPYDRLTASRDGTYWNLLAPYALASGFFPPHGVEARGLLRYLLGHGSRLLGLVRSSDAKLYGNPTYPVSGTDQVYGLSVSRFLADNDEPDQLALSLYGMLAASMTPGTFVSGEGATVAPLRGRFDRTMLLPPNSGANATFLETFRLLLVHETRGPDGTPTGLELAFATPRAWLEPGRTIRVHGAPTSFGKVSYTIERRGDRVSVALDSPPAPSLCLRLRLPAGTRISSVRLGGRSLPFDARTGTIDLSGRRGRLALEAIVSRARGS
jgi:hypothetical protein